MEIIILAVALLVAIVLLRTLALQPTAAKTLKLEFEKSERATKYGKQLSKMIQDETISSRFDQDITKFEKFHKTLEELFPNVHKVCEKTVIDGNLLYKWAVKSS